MNKNIILKYRIEGLPIDKGHIRLTAFLGQLQQLNFVLKSIEGDLVGRGKNIAYYRIIDLRHSSPSVMAIEPVSIKKQYQKEVEKITPAFVDTVKAIKRRETKPDYISYHTVGAIKELIDPLGKDYESATLFGMDERIDFDAQLKAEVELLLMPKYHCIGTVKGKLEILNLHNKKEFRVYPKIGADGVVCTFHDKLRDVVIKAVDKEVLITGLLTYQGGENFPYKVKVKDIQIVPDELPHLLDLRGIAPDATGKLSSEEFVRNLRNEWQ